ncbi:unnamed protein product [Chondrus crispus]|uniref:Uncharacterized protein n=1 Tax=Chondrus crispus TaxID=2769 RepID=R7QIS4_CHOCR|nr:unnamed protein product [Chondrus crispus]CDF38412.1 unnamed protein product [Chondrus crispus]|eukprot:XP_005718305.1 unnamed protein product [Chondrus crispus]
MTDMGKSNAGGQNVREDGVTALDFCGTRERREPERKQDSGEERGRGLTDDGRPRPRYEELL